MPSTEEVPECLACGACCFSELPTYARVTGDDHSRLATLGERAPELVQFIGNRAYMRIVDGRCAALEIDRANRRFVCTVYAVRPTICRELGRGSPECRGEIATKADRPGALLRVSR